MERGEKSRNEKSEPKVIVLGAIPVQSPFFAEKGGRKIVRIYLTKGDEGLSKTSNIPMTNITWQTADYKRDVQKFRKPMANATWRTADYKRNI